MRTFVIGSALVLASCAAHVASSVRVDGAAFSPSACRSGQANGFSGVELQDPSGQRLRLAQNLDGTVAAVYFPPGETVGDQLGGCFTMNTQHGLGVVNGIRNVEGTAILSCTTGRHQVSGAVKFENCH